MTLRDDSDIPWLADDQPVESTTPAARKASLAATPKPAPPVRVIPFTAFPVDALPDRMRVFVEAVAEATGTDPAFAALSALVVSAGCVGNRAAVLAKRGWVEPMILWGAIVGRSGTTKSPVMKLVARPLVELLKDERRRHAEAVEEHRREAEHHAVRMAEWKRSQREGPPTDPPVEPAAPIQRRLLVSDITVEKLGELLELNPLGLLLIRDELAAWVGSFDRYGGGKGSDQPTWLSFHDAGMVTIDRKSGKGSYFIERAAVSVLGSIQPGTLARIFGEAEREAGLLSRVLLAYPPDKPSLWNENELDDVAADGWRDLLCDLLAIRPGCDSAGEPRPQFIPVGHEAKPAWTRWHDAHARATVDVDDDDLAACWSKLKGGCIRLALLFACVEAAERGEGVAYVTADAMHRAIRVTDWFKSEAERVYGIFREGDQEHDRRRLLELVERKGGVATARDVLRSTRMFSNATDAEAALTALVEAGIGQWEYAPPGPKGGAPSKAFRLLPRSEPLTLPHPELTQPRASGPKTGFVNCQRPEMVVDETPDEGGEWGAA